MAQFVEYYYFGKSHEFTISTQKILDLDWIKHNFAKLLYLDCESIELKSSELEFSMFCQSEFYIELTKHKQSDGELFEKNPDKFAGFYQYTIDLRCSKLYRYSNIFSKLVKRMLYQFIDRHSFICSLDNDRRCEFIKFGRFLGYAQSQLPNARQYMFFEIENSQLNPIISNKFNCPLIEEKEKSTYKYELQSNIETKFGLFSV